MTSLSSPPLHSRQDPSCLIAELPFRDASPRSLGRCMVELINAVDLHANKQLQIILVLIEGEQWPEVIGDEESGMVDWPPIAEVCKNLSKWFPEMLAEQRDESGNALPGTTLYRIEELYSYGPFTQERLLRHTLIHYKAFERLLLARCGVSIKVNKILNEIVANGGSSLDAKTAALHAVVAEANVMSKLLGQATTYVVLYDFYKAEVNFKEMLGEHQSGTLTAEQFLSHALVLRSETDNMRAATTAFSANLLEQWQLMSVHSPNTTIEFDVASDGNVSQLVGLFGYTQQVIKVIVSFFQINTSFLNVFFGRIPWPSSLTNLISPFLALFEPIGLYLDSFSSVLTTFDHVKITYVAFTLCIAVLAFFVLVYLLFTKLLCKATMSEQHKQQFLDYTIFSAVLFVFLLYPSLSARTLRLFRYSTYGEHTLLTADLRLTYDELFAARMIGLVFLLLFVLGVPALGYAILYRVAGPARRNAHAMYHKLDERRAEMDRRYARRFGILYNKYEPACWWWEVFDVLRKLGLTTIIVFFEAASVLQVRTWGD